MFTATSIHVDSNHRTNARIDGIQKRERQRITEEKRLADLRRADDIDQRERHRREKAAQEAEERAQRERTARLQDGAIAALRERMELEVAMKKAAYYSHHGYHSLGYIAAMVCWFYGIEERELKSGRRARHIVRAKQAFHYWAKHLTNNSFPQIGRYIGQDHTTVMHGAETYLSNKAKAKARKAAR